MTGWLEFDVIGKPAPQGSKRAFVRNGRANLVEVAGAALKTWRADVEAAARAHAGPYEWVALEDPAEVQIEFRMPRPKSRPDGDWHGTRPDVDKLTRAVLDALTAARVWVDDSLVADLRVWKRYTPDGSEPGAVIAVRRIPS